MAEPDDPGLPAQSADGVSDLTERGRKALSDLAGRASGFGRRLSDGAARVASRGRGVLEDVGESTQALWAAENPVVILASPTFTPFPEDAPPREMLSVSWRADALLGLSALGVTVWEKEIVGVTRTVFHDGLSHQG